METEGEFKEVFK